VLVVAVRLVLVLFLSRVALVFVPAAMLGLIYIDPFIGLIVALLIMSLLLTLEIPLRYRIIAAMVLPQTAFFLAFGDHFGSYVSLIWSWTVAMRWPRDRQP
jgi:hypothetical protein